MTFHNMLNKFQLSLYCWGLQDCLEYSSSHKILVNLTVNFLSQEPCFSPLTHEVRMATIIIHISYMRKLKLREFRTLPKVTQLISGIVKTVSRALWLWVQPISYNHRFNVPCLQAFLPSLFPHITNGTCPKDPACSVTETTATVS